MFYNGKFYFGGFDYKKENRLETEIEAFTSNIQLSLKTGMLEDCLKFASFMNYTSQIYHFYVKKMFEAMHQLPVNKNKVSRFQEIYLFKKMFVYFIKLVSIKYKH